MVSKWVVVGVSGATCSGKTTLAKNLHKVFPQSVTISQDDYFFPPDSTRHVLVESLGHLNWELMSALDMESMKADVRSLLSQDPSTAVLPAKAKRSEKILQNGTENGYPHILILEGFLLLNDHEISDMCDLRYYLTLTREQCWHRRHVRVYDPPDIPGYFEQVVWPEYVKNRDQVLLKPDVRVLDGALSQDGILCVVRSEIGSASEAKGKA